ncbi:MAG: hypothetical protein ACQCN6_12645 [Candidatus Bathyarchaeia archaeon]
MGRTNKTYTLILTLIIATSCLTMLNAKPADAQTIPKPSVPNFDIALIDSSYEIPPTSTVNPYNGEVTTEAGRHVESRTIQISVKNQPFTPFTVQWQSGDQTYDKTVYLHYEVRWKGHFETEWHQQYYPLENYYMISPENARLKNEYSIFTYKGDYSSAGWSGMGPTMPQDAQIDFQVKAYIGYVQYVQSSIAGLAFNGEESDWSNTQTIALTQSPTSPSASPAIPELSWLAIVPMLLSLLSVAWVVKHRKTSK